MADPNPNLTTTSTNLPPPAPQPSADVESQSQSRSQPQAPPPRSTTPPTTPPTLPHPIEFIPSPLSPIILRAPHRYEKKPTTTSPSKPQTQAQSQKAAETRARAQAAADSGPVWTPPPLQWLERTWTVTHSTLPMWRNAKNVRITYKILEPSKPGAPIRLDDIVESEPTKRTLMPQPKKIEGIDTPDPEREGAWNWRGKGLLKIASSHWEVLGWGERGEGDGKERWVVTWFAPSLFTPAGIDVYSDRKEGGSEALVRDVLGALERMGCGEVSDLCKGEMRVVMIDKN